MKLESSQKHNGEKENGDLHRNVKAEITRKTVFRGEN